MYFREIKPYVRYARYMLSSPADTCNEVIPYDSRIFFTLSGEGAISASDSEYRMQSGALLLLPSGVPYSIIPPTNEVRYAIINFDYTCVEKTSKAPIAPAQKDNFKKEELIPVPRFEESIPSDEAIYIKNAMPLCDTILDTVREYSRRMLYFEEKCTAHLSALLFEIYRRALTGGFHSDMRIDDILGFIDLHFSEELSNKRIAEEFSFHPNHISAVIKQATGMPLHKYLIHTRLRHAIDMMDAGEKNISSISEACGFFDVAHFSRTFKSVFGCNPKDYGTR